MIEKTKEDYLRAIYHLREEKDNDIAGISSVDLCDYLNLSKSSVSEMLRKLMRERLIKPVHYGKINLTKKGISEARTVTRKHRIIEVFLLSILKIKSKKIHDEAHSLEHAFSNDSINAIGKLIKNIKNCPHGKPIP